MSHQCDQCGEDTAECDLMEHGDEFWCANCVELDKYGYWELESAILEFMDGHIGGDRLRLG